MLKTRTHITFINGNDHYRFSKTLNVFMILKKFEFLKNAKSNLPNFETFALAVLLLFPNLHNIVTS